MWTGWVNYQMQGGRNRQKSTELPYEVYILTQRRWFPCYDLYMQPYLYILNVNVKCITLYGPAVTYFQMSRLRCCDFPVGRRKRGFTKLHDWLICDGLEVMVPPAVDLKSRSSRRVELFAANTFIFFVNFQRVRFDGRMFLLSSFCLGNELQFCNVHCSLSSPSLKKNSNSTAFLWDEGSLSGFTFACGLFL